MNLIMHIKTKNSNLEYTLNAKQSLISNKFRDRHL